MMTLENPFPGLRPFEAAESHLFFGRETATDELLKKLRHNRFISVIGTSGSGKSSLVRAGMLPDLYGGYMASAGSDWCIAVLRPGQAPIYALAAALVESGVFGSAGNDTAMQVAINETILRRGEQGLINVVRQARMPSGCNLLIVVDQFEELFRFMHTPEGTQPKEEAAAFVKLLLEASHQIDLPIYVILTMRSEYLGDCTQFRHLAETINNGQYLIPRMTREQKQLAITGPIAVGGAGIAPRLVQRLLNDVGDNPDQLPIMQHAMMRSWEYWEAENQPKEVLDLHHYNITGGMSEALSRHADEAFAELTESDKYVAEVIFKRLTGKGTDNREMRFPTTFEELCSITESDTAIVKKVINTFRAEGRSFLMPSPLTELSSDTLIDISHESLIRIWNRLRSWVNEEAQSAGIYRRLTETAILYGNKQAGLWRDPDLQIALAWRKKNQPNAMWSKRYNSGFSDAMNFIHKSKLAARRKKILLRTALIMLPLIPIVYYVYDLKNDLNVKQNTISHLNEDLIVKRNTINELDSQVHDNEALSFGTGHSAFAQAETLQKVREQVEESKLVIQEVKNELSKEVEQGHINDTKIIGQISGSVNRLQDSLIAIEQIKTNTVKMRNITQESQAEIPSKFKSLLEEKLTNDVVYLTKKKDSVYITEPQNFDTCENIDELNPKGCQQQFRQAQKVYFFCRIKGVKDDTLKLVWYKNYQPYSDRDLKISANNIMGFRTFVWKRFTNIGDYQVALYDGDQLIAARKFTIH